MLLLAFTALKDGIRRSGFVFRVALHEGEHALLIAIGFDWGGKLFILGALSWHFALQLALIASILIGNTG